MTFDIEAMERQLRADERRCRDQVRHYEAYQTELQMQIGLAILAYSIALGSCWAMALRPAFEVNA